MFLTQFGNSLGKGLYFLVTEKAIFCVAFVSYKDCLELGFTPYSLMNSEDQSRVWDCWKKAVEEVVPA